MQVPIGKVISVDRIEKVFLIEISFRLVYVDLEAVASSCIRESQNGILKLKTLLFKK